jgi:hypothetical protein
MPSTPPGTIQPADPSDRARVKEQSLRWRILKGHHRSDIKREIEQNVAPELADELIWSIDISANPLKLVFNQLNIAYVSPPGAGPAGLDDGAEPPDLSSVITPYLWPLMGQRALFQMGIRECFVRLDWPSAKDIEAGELPEARYRIVPPDCVHTAKPHPRRPDQVGYVEELRERFRTTLDKDGREVAVSVWTYDVWDVREKVPVFRVLEATDARRDVTAEFTGPTPTDGAAADEASGYPYIDQHGRPIMPYILAHAEVQSDLWDWMEGTELVGGTLKLAMGWTWWWDGFQNAANPQRVALDLKFGGSRTTTVASGANVETIPVSPKSVLLGESNGPPGSGRIDSFPPGMDVAVGVSSLRSYEERLALFAGISPSDLQVTGSPQSGIAIQVSRDGLRSAQQRYEPAYRMADQLILATAARMANKSISGLNLPEDPRGWSVSYRQLGESSPERKVKAETVTLERNAGTLGQVGAVRRMHPSLASDEEAIDYIANQARLDARAAAAAAKARGEVMVDTDSIGAEAATIFAVLQAAAAQGRPLTPEELNDLAESAAEIAGLTMPTGGTDG